MNKRSKIVLGILSGGALVAGLALGIVWMFRDTPKPPKPPEDQTKPTVEYVAQDLEIKADKLSPEGLKSVLLQRATATDAKDAELLQGSEAISKDTAFMARYLADCLAAGKTPVIKQAVEANVELLSVSLDSPEAHGPLPCAVAMYGDAELLAWLIDKYPQAATSGQKEGTSLLHAAIAGNASETINWLIANRKEQLAVRNDLGQTPLHSLIGNPSAWMEIDVLAIVRSLIDASPELISAQDSSGKTPLMQLESVAESPIKTSVRELLAIPPSAKK